MYHGNRYYCTTLSFEVLIAVLAVSDVINPACGIFVTTFNTFLSKFDELKINYLLFGLSKGLDMERQINELYNYVCSSSARAFIVGYIISKHLD